MTLPNDPFMLLSYINTQLRDKYPSLEALCEDLDADASEITEKLKAVGYSYVKELNKFL